MKQWVDDNFENLLTVWAAGWLGILAFGMSGGKKTGDPLMLGLVLFWLWPIYLCLIACVVNAIFRTCSRFGRRIP